MRLPQSRVTTVAAVAAVAVLAAVGVVVGISAGHSSGKGSLAGSDAPAPPAVLRVLHLRHHKLPFNHKLTFKVANGALTAVAVAEPSGSRSRATSRPITPSGAARRASRRYAAGRRVSTPTSSITR